MNTPPSITADNEIILHYTKGDQCGNGNVSTTVYLKCPDTEVHCTLCTCTMYVYMYMYYLIYTFNSTM